MEVVELRVHVYMHVVAGVTVHVVVHLLLVDQSIGRNLSDCPISVRKVEVCSSQCFRPIFSKPIDLLHLLSPKVTSESKYCLGGLTQSYRALT